MLFQFLALISLAQVSYASSFDCEAPAMAPLRPDQFHYEIYNPGQAQTLVLVHGLDSAGVTFQPIIKDLARRFTVLVYDQRGHGRSQAIGMNYSNTVMAADLAALLNHLQIRKAHLLGHSMGGRTVLRFAQLHPERVESIIVEDMEMIARTREPEKDVLLEKAKRLEKFPSRFESESALVDALTELYGNREHAQSVAQRRARKNADGSYDLLFRPHVTVLYGTQANALDLSADGVPRNVPLLFLRADPRNGSAMSREGVQQIQRDWPHSRIVTIPNSSHNVHGSQTKLFLGEVIPFIEQAKGTHMASNPKVSTLGTQNHADLARQRMVPRGSAVLTSSGKLAESGITAIIHAASGSMTKDGAEYSPTLQSVQLAVANSLELARRFEHRRIAIPFIGGKIFLARIGAEPIELAQAIVDAALQSRGEVEVRFVTFGAQDTALFQRALKKHHELVSAGTVGVVDGSITDFSLHGASAIVNAANMEVQFGGGVSGVIGNATGETNHINSEAIDLIRQFHTEK